MKKIICVNGPPRAGKDTVFYFIRGIIKEKYPELKVIREKFASPLDNIAKAVLNMDDDNYEIYREQLKDSSLPEYPNVSLRDVLIYSSENYCKVLFGQEYFAVEAVKRVNQSDADIIVFTDSGFQVEFDRLVQSVNIETKLIRITRPECTFDNDSREFVNTPDYYIENNQTLGELYDKVEAIICEI